MPKKTIKPDATWSMRRLRGYACAWCDQGLDQARQGFCGSIYGMPSGCYWVSVLCAADLRSPQK